MATYPIAIHHDPDSAWGVTVPDLPGCFSAGDTLDEALRHAADAIVLFAETLVEDSQPVPLPQSVDTHRANPRFADAVWALVPVDLEAITGPPVRLNVMLPQAILAQADAYAKAHHLSRSGFIARAIRRELQGT